MKRILFLLIITILIVTICGCTFVERTLFSGAENAKEKPVEFYVEKIALSKGFQSTEPSVEIVKKDNNNKLLASLGLIESSGVQIDKITKSDKDINIYISKLSSEDDIQLAVPQILFEIKDSSIESLDDLNFNIINQNYEPISLKFSKSQILNNVYSKFKITATTIPTVELTKAKGKTIWNISFRNIFDQENTRPSLINFNVKVDALTGEILKSKKDDISTYIDDGYILDYIPNTYLLYKKQDLKEDNEYESLWSYDIKNGKRKNLYTSKSKIQSATFSPDGEHISVIEVVDNKSDIYIISKADMVPYKITPTNHLNPRLMKWKDNNNLHFVNLTEEISTLLTYKIDENKSEVNFSSKLKIEDFDVLENQFIFLESNEDSVNKTIYISENGFDLTEIGNGFQATFFDENTVLYLNNMENEDKNIIYKYDIKNKFPVKDPKYNVKNYFKINENHILFIEKNTCNNDYTLNKYNIFEKTIEPVANITSDKIYYDSEDNLGFISLTPPDSDINKNMIYSIDLSKLNIIND